MEAARRRGAGGALVALFFVSLGPACEDGRAIEAEQLCPLPACDGGDCASRAQSNTQRNQVGQT